MARGYELTYTKADRVRQLADEGLSTQTTCQRLGLSAWTVNACKRGYKMRKLYGDWWRRTAWVLGFSSIRDMLVYMYYKHEKSEMEIVGFLEVPRWEFRYYMHKHNLPLRRKDD